MDFEITVVSLLVILYIVSIFTVYLIIYMCLKLRSINQSHGNIDTTQIYLDNRAQTTETIQTRSDLETVLETNNKSNTSLKADSLASLHNSNNSHIHNLLYEDIEDFYIDDSLPRNLDTLSKNPNFPEPFYYSLDPESEECLCKGACSCKMHLYH